MTYSQFKDEEIILDCLKITGALSKTCCEFGAWDGLKFSNTAYLIRHLGWTGTFIEALEERIQECRDSYSDFPETTIIKSIVTPENVNDLVPDGLDFLSIDIDGHDYWIWNALRKRPGLVCIEFNNEAIGRPYEEEYIRTEGDHTYGATEWALDELAERKNYLRLASDGNCNIFYGDRRRMDK